MKSNSFINRLTIAVFCLLALNSCHRADNSDKMIFRYNEVAGISTLDPAFSKDQALNWACSQLYNGLVRLDEELNVQPCIARCWDISSDGTIYTFHLRRDVYFHKDAAFCHKATSAANSSTANISANTTGNTSPNGTTPTLDSTRHVTAQDFVYSLRRIIDPSVASPGLWIFNAVDSINSFQAVDDSTLRIHLSHPFAPFLSLLAMPYCSVVPHEVVERWGDDFRRHPCGTGPFRLQLWKEGVKLVLRRNDNYFEKDSLGQPLPYLDAVAVTFIVDKQTAFLEFIKGNLDFMNSLDASYKDELLTRTGQLKAKYQGKIVMECLTFLNTEYLGFNMSGNYSASPTKSNYGNTTNGKAGNASRKNISSIPDGNTQKHSNPLADKRVRQAINYGLDRTKMMKYLRNGIGRPGEQGFIPLGLPGSDTAACYGYSYNPERARQLLADAGYPDGKGLPELKLSTTSSYLDLCRYLQQQLGLIGIKVALDVNPPAALREEIAQGKMAWFRGSWIADYPDAENYLSLFYSANETPAGPNTTHFRNAAFDRLYERSQQETDNQRRVQLYRQMDSLVMEEAPVLVLYYDQILHFTHPYVTGLRSNAMNALDLRYVHINKNATADK